MHDLFKWQLMNATAFYIIQEGGGGGGSEPRIICIWLSSHSKVNPKQNYRLNPKAPDVKKYLKKEQFLFYILSQYKKLSYYMYIKKACSHNPWKKFCGFRALTHKTCMQKKNFLRLKSKFISGELKSAIKSFKIQNNYCTINPQNFIRLYDVNQIIDIQGGSIFMNDQGCRKYQHKTLNPNQIMKLDLCQ